MSEVTLPEGVTLKQLLEEAAVEMQQRAIGKLKKAAEEAKAKAGGHALTVLNVVEPEADRLGLEGVERRQYVESHPHWKDYRYAVAQHYAYLRSADALVDELTPIFDVQAVVERHGLTE
jgi:hypothetical protein